MLAHLRSPRPRISGAVRVWCLTGVLMALSLAALLMAADSMAPPLGGIQVPWWMLAAGFAVTEVFVLDVSSARNERWLTLSEVPLVIGLVFSTPTTIVAAQALGVAAVLVLYRREKPLRCAFNVAQRAAATLVAVFVFVPIVHVAGSTWPIIWLAGFAATLSADIVAGILTNAAIALSEGVRMRFEHVLGIGLALTFAKTGLALTVVMVMTEYPAGLVVVAIPVAAAFLAGRAHVEVRRERDDMVKLQRATGLAQRSLHPDEMLPLLLEHLREMFHADIAELVLSDQKAKDHLASRIGPGGAVAILTPIDLDPTQGVWARVVAEGEGVLLARPIRNPLLAEHFSSLGINDAIVAPVSCEDGPSGILTIANRVGDFSTFGTEDLHLLEALAKHIGVTIRNSRLTLRLEDALEREAETNKLKDDFLATISHELRSPLDEYARVRQDDARRRGRDVREGAGGVPRRRRPSRREAALAHRGSALHFPGRNAGLRRSLGSGWFGGTGRPCRRGSTRALGTRPDRSAVPSLPATGMDERGGCTEDRLESPRQRAQILAGRHAGHRIGRDRWSGCPPLVP